MRKGSAILLVAVLWSSVASAQTRPQAKTGIQGAWLLTEEATTGLNAVTYRSPQPGLYIFTANHYSLARVVGDTPRKPAADPSKVTFDELREIRRFASQSGTYQINGDELVVRRIVALEPANMAPGNSATYSFKLAGDTLWLAQKTSQGTAAVNPSTFKLRRVE